MCLTTLRLKSDAALAAACDSGTSFPFQILGERRTLSKRLGGRDRVPATRHPVTVATKSRCANGETDPLVRSTK